MKLTHFAAAICLYSLSAASPLYAQDFDCNTSLPEAEQKRVVKELEERYAAFSDLEAQFIQQSYFVGLNQKVNSRGTVFFKKPGKMDWRYEEPDKQRFISDGSSLWFYQPELNQVTVGNFRQAFDSDLPVSFLLGVGKLNENFSVQSACRSPRGIVLRLIPQPADPNLQEFYLLVDPGKYIPTGGRIIDIGGNETAIVFNDVRLNSKLPDESFSFTPPRGTDIIDQRSSESGLSRR